MKKTTAMFVAMCFVLGFLVPQAHALQVALATIASGQIHVIGSQAEKKANITWDGKVVTQANNGGAFQFNTTDLPSTCVGTLSDGVSTIQVVLQFCGPVKVMSKVLATGQTGCWDSSGASEPCAGTGQDGEFQKGAPRSYTDNGDGTITDNLTGLLWEKLDNWDGIENWSDLHDADNDYNWDQAFGKIAALNGANFAGHNDWRLPNVNELLTLVDYGVTSLIDPVFIPTGGGLWSSTSYVFDASWALVVGTGGVMELDHKATSYGWVRGVRGSSCHRRESLK